MEAEPVSRAIAAATALVGGQGLSVHDVVVVQNSNKLALRLLPCDVFARVAPVGDEAFALEVELAQRLAAIGSPVAALEPRVEPRVFDNDGFAMTFWTYYDDVAADRLSPDRHADALHRLHAGMRTVDVSVPQVADRVAEAVELVVNPDRTPALDEADRQLLLGTLGDASERIHGWGRSQQLLHGEPHAGNILNTQGGPVFIDLETCCRGPVELDVAHLPEHVSVHYPDVDQRLIEECRRLVLAMVAAWRWDARDEFPDGHRHGRDIVALLRAGPPWPSLGALTE